MAAVLCGGLVMACGGHHRAEPPPAGARVGAAIVAAMGAADHAREPWRCARVTGPGLTAETLLLARSWRLAGHEVALVPTTATPPGAGSAGATSSARELTIAVIADAGGASPSTIAALSRLREAWGPVDLVIALGGMGTTQADLEATLGTLAEHSTVPVIALPGDLEGVSAQSAAIAALHARGEPIVDGRLVRRIALPGATIATLGGASAAERLSAAADGCVFAPAEATAALASVAAEPGLRIAALPEAPRLVRAGEATGDLSMPATALDVVLHAPVAPEPTPARAGHRDGAAAPLTPGTSDATTRLPAGVGMPSAGLLTVGAGVWRWRPVLARGGT